MTKAIVKFHPVKPRLTMNQKRVQKAVAFLKHYFDTYDAQYGYLDYSDKTIINDVLYALGAALDDKYRFANGFAAFKTHLRGFLDKEPA